MKLIFKYVGQGDSIIIHWEENQDNKFIIIDCNENEGRIPTLDYVTSFENAVIELIILSHPHDDHYSGMRQLLLSCEQAGIAVKKFFHTAMYAKQYLEKSVTNLVSREELIKLFILAKNKMKAGSLELGAIDATTFGPVPFGQSWKLSVLSPTATEYEKYSQLSDLPITRRNQNNNPDANWLSTIITIENKSSIYLLTSDCDKYSLIRIDKINFDKDKKMVVGQSPHHGAFNNHNNAFWRKRNWVDFPQIAISTGPNSYGHPSPAVINFFTKQGYTTRITGDINGMIPEIEEKINALANISILEVESPIDKRDIVFDLE
ncbi:MAG: hypothetical protein C7N36_14835 [Bacteroidetes bacterium]|nr:MAG: hypothetical protein C7N36_14835 [Bacteroidota bacterium]